MGAVSYVGRDAEEHPEAHFADGIGSLLEVVAPRRACIRPGPCARCGASPPTARRAVRRVAACRGRSPRRAARVAGPRAGQPKPEPRADAAGAAEDARPRGEPVARAVAAAGAGGRRDQRRGARGCGRVLTPNYFHKILKPFSTQKHSYRTPPHLFRARLHGWYHAPLRARHVLSRSCMRPGAPSCKPCRRCSVCSLPHDIRGRSSRVPQLRRTTFVWFSPPNPAHPPSLFPCVLPPPSPSVPPVAVSPGFLLHQALRLVR